MLSGCVAFRQLLYRGLRTETDAPQRSAPATAMKLSVTAIRFGDGQQKRPQRRLRPWDDPATQIRAGGPCAALIGLGRGGAAIIRPGRQWLRIELGRGPRAAAAPVGFLRRLLGGLLARFLAGFLSAFLG